MTQRRWDVLIAAVLCTGLGIGSGFYAAIQAGLGAAHAADPAPDPSAAGHDHKHFSPESLRNMGIEIGEVTLTSTTRTRGIVGAIDDTARTEQPVQAPFGGVVIEVPTLPGQVVAAGAVVARIVRDPIPPPVLQLTLEYAVPSHDEIHHAIRELREAHTDQTIAAAELERISAFTDSGGDGPLLPAQRRIDLEYQVSRAALRREVAEHELERHGFSDAQLAGLIAGEHVELFDADHTRRALEHGGFWRSNAERLLRTLPADKASLSFVVATLAELAGRGLADDALCAWFEAEPSAAAHCIEIASLLLSGTSLAGVEQLAALGALEPVIEVCAPSRSADWDVAALHVRDGDRVAAGTTLVTLRDPRLLRLRIEPVGSELAALRRMIEDGTTCSAIPLVVGAGPGLSDLRIDYLATEGEDPRPVAYAMVANTAIVAADATSPFRSWQLQHGARYRVLVPTHDFHDVYVVPRGAVADDGPDRVVFVPTGDGGFEERPVVILHEDDTVIVIAPDDHLAPGTRIVTHGAFELGLAMHAGDQAMAHDHDH